MRARMVWLAVCLILALPRFALAGSCEITLPGGGAVINCTLPTLGAGWATVPIAASAPITTGMVLGVNVASFPLSTPLPLPSQGIIAYNRVGSAGPFYFCPLGGTCGTTTGIEIGIGASKTFPLGLSTVVPTAYSPLGATGEFRW